IRGNGPFFTKRIDVGKPLTIRAGEGFRPVIKADSEMRGSSKLLTSMSSLVLEGLELQWLDAYVNPETSCHVLFISGPASQLHAANCRLLMNRSEGKSSTWGQGILGWGAPQLSLQNCQLLVARNAGISFNGNLHAELRIDNCLVTGGVILGIQN